MALTPKRLFLYLCISISLLRPYTLFSRSPLVNKTLFQFNVEDAPGLNQEQNDYRDAAIMWNCLCYLPVQPVPVTLQTPLPICTPFPLYPASHEHVYDPWLLEQTPPSDDVTHWWKPVEHSSISEMNRKGQSTASWSVVHLYYIVSCSFVDNRSKRLLNVTAPYTFLEALLLSTFTQSQSSRPHMTQ